MRPDPGQEVDPEAGRTTQEPARLRVVRGGTPSADEMAAIAAAVQVVSASGIAAGPGGATEPDEWALQGRMAALGWQPLQQRWPGEPDGRSWRRALD